MPITYNADEILEFAVEIERNGQAFYGKAAEIVADEDVKKLLLELVAWEARHERIFSEMQMRLAETRPDLSAFDPEGEASKYLQAIADGKIFNVSTMADELSQMSSDPLDILTTALGREKDAVIFFMAMKELVPDNFGRDEVDTIVQEEMSHIRFIAEEIEALEE
jgi:rubrerythrin